MICYVTDTEHTPDVVDDDIVELIRGADLFVYDCTYTDEEFPSYVGWGHSTWQQGVRLSDAAGVKTLVTFHHDMSRDDRALDALAEQLARTRPGSIVAREGLVLTY